MASSPALNEVAAERAKIVRDGRRYNVFFDGHAIGKASSKSAAFKLANERAKCPHCHKGFAECPSCEGTSCACDTEALKKAGTWCGGGCDSCTECESGDVTCEACEGTAVRPEGDAS